MLLAACLCFAGCGKAPVGSPLETIKARMTDVPTYSIILEDMRTSGNFIRAYHHKFRVVEPEDATTTDWMDVSEKFYKAHGPHLGMSLYSKKDGEAVAGTTPPGYAYVGDSRYGQWREDRRGNSFWEFYGKYALISHFLGGWYRPVYRNDYNNYRSYRSRNRTYFGRNNQYGSTGSIVKKQKPNFYARKMARQQSSGSQFKKRVSNRIGRTRTGYRGRSAGFGK